MLAQAGGIEVQQSMTFMSSAVHCAKMQVLESLLRRWHHCGDKVRPQQKISDYLPPDHSLGNLALSPQVLIFSFSVRVLDCIEEMLRVKGYHAERLDGSTPPDQRQSKVDEFNNSAGIFAFLISTTAGELRVKNTEKLSL